ncbi:hypothetical protein PR202_gb03538 [Eleusine coracana subsp. coracana]|uniref:Uncharacterized protein n=1 Tax=Eleusine coracana subsp. coracana TaxID=191504 RepID=A0AAV5E1E2_ELECO|nr:hypothetical protein PR202_gb03538 [Eleusine coracana subsp. coracana]
MINHLLVGCILAGQFWFLVLQQAGLQVLAPQPEDSNFDEWWEQEVGRCGLSLRKGLSSFIVPGAWTLWNHRNRRVFNSVSPSINEPVHYFKEEAKLWMMAGAKGLSLVLPLPPVE